MEAGAKLGRLLIGARKGGRFASGLLGLVVRGAARVILPPVCPLCSQREPEEPEAFCTQCKRGLSPLCEPFCVCCGLPFHGSGISHLCPRCTTDPPPFEVLRVWGLYEGTLLDAIRAFKFGGRLALRRALERLLIETYDRSQETLRAPLAAVVPVPCRPAVLRKRGFDLPALVSRALADSRSLPWRPQALTKVGDTPDLVGLSATARFRSVARAYRPSESLSGAVLLVDDVVTTTATARACARACLDAGADRAVVLALARTPLENP